MGAGASAWARADHFSAHIIPPRIRNDAECTNKYGSNETKLPKVE
jgi:hypothetical protein